MPFLLTLLAAKGLGALVGSLLLATRPVPGFTSPALVVRSDMLVLQTTLAHGFNRELDQVLESGSLVAIGFTATLQTRAPGDRNLMVAKTEFYHSGLYDPVSKSYSVFRSELSASPESLLTGLTAKQAKVLLTTVAVTLASAAELPEGHEVCCRLEGALNTIRLEAVDGKELDLNVFWNYHYPRAVTPWQRPKP
jgi:hypothetical protein